MMRELIAVLVAAVATVVVLAGLGILFVLAIFGIRFFKGGSQWSDDSPWHLE